jgi:hypothetical protein
MEEDSLSAYFSNKDLSNTVTEFGPCLSLALNLLKGYMMRSKAMISLLRLTGHWQVHLTGN